MKFRTTSPTGTENRVSFRNFAEVKATGAMSLDKAIRPASLQGTKPMFQRSAKENHPLWTKTQPLKIDNKLNTDSTRRPESLKDTKTFYQRPKDSLWRNSIELKVTKQTPRMAGLDNKQRERTPGTTAPSLYERKAQTEVKVTLPKALTEAKLTAKTQATPWNTVQARYAEKKGPHVAQAKQLAPKTATELATKAKEARLQTRPDDVKAQAQKLQKEYRKRFALPEHTVNPTIAPETRALAHGTNIQSSLAKKLQPKTPESAQVETQKIMEQAAVVLQVVQRFEEHSPKANQVPTLGQEKILQLVHETLQKRGLTEYVQTGQQAIAERQEQIHALPIIESRTAPQFQIGTAERTATKTEGHVQDQEEVLQPQAVLVAETKAAVKIDVSPKTADLQTEQVQAFTQATPQVFSTHEETATETVQGVQIMTQEETRAQLQEQVQSEAIFEGRIATTLRREVKFVNGQFVVEQEEIVAERDPEADQERVNKAVEVGSAALGQAETASQNSISSHVVAARMPQKPNGGLLSKIRQQLNLPLDTEKQYDTFKQVLAGTQQTMQNSSDIQQVATYATDVAPAVRLNTRVTTEPVKPVDELRAMSEGEEKTIYLQQYQQRQAQAA